VIASLPSLCLLAAFAGPTADLLANGELREANLISELGACLAVAAFAQMAGGIHDYGRQALFSLLDDKGPRIASFIGLAVGVVVAFSTLLLPADGSRLAGLVVCVARRRAGLGDHGADQAAHGDQAGAGDQPGARGGDRAGYRLDVPGDHRRALGAARV